MKPRSTLFLATALYILAGSVINTTAAQQQYKLRQGTTISGMKSETTIYVKGKRKRTEGTGMMGMGTAITTIEQCDLQRTIHINDKKKLYFIEPFSTEQEEVIDEDAKPAAVKTKPVTSTEKDKKGGVIHLWYNITDTGERKKMYGFTARHVWSTQKMKPTPEACTMKDSFIIKTDGWYIDFPEFNCPVRYKPVQYSSNPQQQQPTCKDRFINHRSGKGKMGFALTETRTIIMGNGPASTSTFETNLETLELTTGKLDSMLFEIPPGYTQAKTEDELQDKFDVNDYIKQATNEYKNDMNNAGNPAGAMSDVKKPGVIRIGVYQPKGGEELQFTALQQHIVGNLYSGNVEAVAVSTEEEARKVNCDYTLGTDIIKMKQTSKVGGLLKAIKNTDPSGSVSYNVEAAMILISLADGTAKAQPKMSGKYEGKPDEAAQRATDEGCRQVLKALK